MTFPAFECTSFKQSHINNV